MVIPLRLRKKTYKKRFSFLGLPILFLLLCLPYANLAGYKFVDLLPSDRLSAEIGLKYGHNEVCYPLTLVLGDIIKALPSEKYSLEDIAVAITQTGGQCRATNFIAQIKTGLTRTGYEAVPVIAFAAGQ